MGGVDGDVRLRLILVAARFFAFWKSWIVFTSPLPLDQQEVVVVCALEQDSLCGRLPPPQLRRASKQVESTATLLSHPDSDSPTDSSSASHNLLVRRYFTQSYYQITFEPSIKDHKQARNV